jgi:hypothetical protein
MAAEAGGVRLHVICLHAPALHQPAALFHCEEVLGFCVMKIICSVLACWPIEMLFAPAPSRNSNILVLFIVLLVGLNHRLNVSVGYRPKLCVGSRRKVPVDTCRHEASLHSDSGATTWMPLAVGTSASDRSPSVRRDVTDASHVYPAMVVTCAPSQYHIFEPSSVPIISRDFVLACGRVFIHNIWQDVEPSQQGLERAACHRIACSCCAVYGHYSMQIFSGIRIK